MHKEFSMFYKQIGVYIMVIILIFYILDFVSKMSIG